MMFMYFAYKYTVTKLNTL